jgi:hypothetical protein
MMAQTLYLVPLLQAVAAAGATALVAQALALRVMVEPVVRAVGLVEETLPEELAQVVRATTVALPLDRTALAVVVLAQQATAAAAQLAARAATARLRLFPAPL